MPRQIILPKKLEDEYRDVLSEQREKDRHVVTPEDQISTETRFPISPDPDDYPTRLVKYIPAEVITLFVTLDTILRGAGGDYELLLWAVFVFGLISTPLYLYRLGGVRNVWQLGVATGAFIVWVFALGGPFAATQWYDPIYGALVLPAYTFLLPIIQIPRAEI